MPVPGRRPALLVRRPWLWLQRSESQLVLLEGAAALFLFAEASALLWFQDDLSTLLQVVLWLQWLATAVGLRYAGLFQLFGPVFFYDLVRSARRRRTFVLRGLYTAGLLLLVYVVWNDFSPNRPGTVSSRQMANFAAEFFQAFVVVQFLVAALLTPAYVASGIAAEKEGQTLPFLLATDLRDREVVLGKLLARLADLGLVVLAGLPILALLQFLGGIDPRLLLAAFATTILTMLSLASVSILFSVLVQRPRDAIIFSYLVLPIYPILSGLSVLLPGASRLSWASPVLLQDLVDWINAGNVFYAVVVFEDHLHSNLPLELFLPALLGRYALFHGLVTGVCCTWAVARLRPVALREAERTQRQGRWRLWQTPPVSEPPMVWKEVHAEAGWRLPWFARLCLAGLVLLSLLPLGTVLFWEEPGQSWEARRWAMNAWVRFLGATVACLMLLAVAIRAAGAITGERRQQTLDALLTSPLDSDEILYGKWLGSVLSLRWCWLWLGLILACGVLTGGVNICAVPLLVGAWFVYAAFAAMVGLGYSVVSASSLRAILYTLVTLMGAWGGHWLLWMCCLCVFSRGGSGPGEGELLGYLIEFQAFGLTPPVALGFLAFQGGEFQTEQYSHHNFGVEFLTCSLLGLAVWGGLTFGLWQSIGAEFRQRTGRGPPADKGKAPAPVSAPTAGL